MLAAVLAVPCVARAQSAVCAPHAPGGVVATEGRGGQGARLIASARGVGLVWVESARWTGPFSGESGSAVSYYGRVFDGTTLAPRAAATNTLLQEAPYAVPMGPVALVRADGALHALDCLCVGGAARFNCALHDLSGGANGERIRPENRQTSVCPMGALSATAVGGEVLAAVPFPDVDGVRMHGTAVGAMQNVALEGEVQVPAMAAVGADRAVFVRRAGDAIEARLFDARGNTQGRPVTLSAAGASVGAPFVLSQGAGVLVSFAQRTGRVRVWELATGEAKHEAELSSNRGFIGPVMAAFDAGSASVLCAHEDIDATDEQVRMTRLSLDARLEGARAEPVPGEALRVCVAPSRLSPPDDARFDRGLHVLALRALEHRARTQVRFVRTLVEGEARPLAALENRHAVHETRQPPRPRPSHAPQRERPFAPHRARFAHARIVAAHSYERLGRSGARREAGAGDRRRSATVGGRADRDGHARSLRGRAPGAGQRGRVRDAPRAVPAAHRARAGREEDARGAGVDLASRRRAGLAWVARARARRCAHRVRRRRARGESVNRGQIR